MTKSHKARKRFGQNFLQDTHIINQIVMAIAPSQDDYVVEIGPGQGAITGPLLDTGCHVDAIELDRDLVERLNAQFSKHEKFKLYSTDALNFNYAQLATNEKIRIVGNLPYNISTPLLFHLLTYINSIHDMHFMLQKEIVNRLQAQPGNKQYGRLSIILQLHCHAEALFDVNPESFDPAPKVMSSIIRLTPHKKNLYIINDKTSFNRMVTSAFSQRRKTIRNSLKTICGVSELEQADINPTERAEDIDISRYVALANILTQQ
ncbi:MAG: 16S rRNA (adenine(1518)-N(6)/adenine(1519)-N(6))-dimethyltransferase [Cycloclasticus sp. symbiont of Poecilosclerida sp. M]|nr:MAG: 16S rRNA (adenine(1518)-N(6)/adenine(1519)-N(6))-dimethyltransferase [Cycloclasticus sp. symbiont of Poecilosclerida sp. M]